MITKRKTHVLPAACIVLLLALIFPGAYASSADQDGYITVGLAPVADFDALYAYNTVPAAVAFRDHSTGTTPRYYTWEFGDGATSTDQNPTHIYIRKGLYTVRLTITNAYGSSTEIKENYIAIGLPPKADFCAAPTTGNTPLNVEFTDRSTGYPTAWKWNFGDGKESADQNPVHTYWSSGEYTVTLTSSNEYGTSQQSEDLRGQFTALIDKDTAAFNKVMEAYGLPKETEPQKALRAAAIREATKEATLVPLEVMKHCIDALALAQQVASKGNPSAVSDAGVSALMLHAAAAGAGLNVKINLNALSEPDFVGWKAEEVESLLNTSSMMLEEIQAVIDSRLVRQ